MTDSLDDSLPKLLVLNGPMKGRYFQVTLPRCWLGRSPSCQITIDDPAMSGFHCSIELIGKHLFISDLASTNGTKLNGLDIGEKPVRLKTGDNILVGETFLRIAVPNFITTPNTPDSSLRPDQPSNHSNTVKHRYFPTFHRFSTAPFCIQFASFFIGLHVLLDILVTSWHKDRVSLLALVSAWLLNDILKGKNYARISLLVIRLSTIPFALVYIGDPNFSIYAMSAICVLGFSLLYLIPLFLPPANRFFLSHPKETQP